MSTLPPGEAGPDHTAVRVALWRALHVQADPPPHVLVDEVGLQLTAPDDGWRERGDMDPAGTRTYRAGVLARARFVEDLVAEQAGQGTAQYVILGAGLDTFAQRRLGGLPGLRVFEVDQPATQVWKRRRLTELGFELSDDPIFVPSDFESDQAWWTSLTTAGFAPDRPAVVASTGVSMYLTGPANLATLRRLAGLAPGSVFAMTFQPPLDLLAEPERAGRQMVEERARAAGTPFLSFYAPDELLDLARTSGFREARHVSGSELNARYFADRRDGLKTTNAEEFLLAYT